MEWEELRPKILKAIDDWAAELNVTISNLEKLGGMSNGAMKKIGPTFTTNKNLQALKRRANMIKLLMDMDATEFKLLFEEKIKHRWVGPDPNPIRTKIPLSEIISTLKGEVTVSVVMQRCWRQPAMDRNLTDQELFEEIHAVAKDAKQLLVWTQSPMIGLGGLSEAGQIRMTSLAQRIMDALLICPDLWLSCSSVESCLLPYRSDKITAAKNLSKFWNRFSDERLSKSAQRKSRLLLSGSSPGEFRFILADWSYKNPRAVVWFLFPKSKFDAGSRHGMIVSPNNKLLGALISYCENFEWLDSKSKAKKLAFNEIATSKTFFA